MIPEALITHIAALPERSFTWAEKVRAIGRELDFRRRVYPDYIAKGRIKKVDADYQIAVFEALLADFDHWLFGHDGGIPAARAIVEQRIRAAADRGDGTQLFQGSSQ